MCEIRGQLAGFSSSTMWVLETKLRSVGLAANTSLREGWLLLWIFCDHDLSHPGNDILR